MAGRNDGDYTDPAPNRAAPELTHIPGINMAELWISLFAVAGLLGSVCWIGFAMVRWRHLAFRNTLIVLQRVARLQDPELTSERLMEIPSPLNQVEQPQTTPLVFFSVGVASASYLLSQVKSKLPGEGFAKYCCRLLFNTKRRDLATARRLSVELKELTELALPERPSTRNRGTVRDQVARQHAFRLRLFAQAIWRFTRLSEKILNISIDESKLKTFLHGRSP
jgi:hypothetical protein